MKILSLFFTCILSVYAQIITPMATIEAGGSVVDLVYNDGILVTSTSMGSIEAYNLQSKQEIFKAKFPAITDFMGDKIAPKIFSVDYLSEIKSYLAVVQASNGFRELFVVHEDGSKDLLIAASEKFFISKAKFVNAHRVLIALLSNEYILFDIQSKKQIYREHISYSHFSDFTLSEDRSICAGSSESGKITLLLVRNGEISKTLEGGNVDNVYKVDIKKDRVLAAGQDRRAIVYDKNTGEYLRFDADFLIYAGALSPSTKKAAFAFDEQNDIVIFDLESQKKIHTLRGQKSTLNSILFLDEQTLVSASDDKYINIWSLK